MGFSRNEVDELIAKAGGLCCKCRELRPVSCHHIISKENGGTDDIDNAIPLCPNCHNEIHYRSAPGQVTRVCSPDQLIILRDETIRLVSQGLLPSNDAVPLTATRIPLMTPSMPENFIARPEEFEKLVKAILESETDKFVAISTALAGSGGYGKTTLAIALCHDDRIKQRFTDGILWVTLGEQPSLLSKLSALYAELTGLQPVVSEEEYIGKALSSLLQHRKCLIVIDDVWSITHLRHFPEGNGSSVRLITTRNLDIAGDNAIQVDEMTSSESVNMLVAGLDPRPTDIAPFERLAQMLGEWPLLLELTNGTLRRRYRAGEPISSALYRLEESYRKHGVTAFDAKNAHERNLAVERSLSASLGLLNKIENKLLAELSIFAEDIPIPIRAIADLWGRDEGETEVYLLEFHALSFIKLSLDSRTVGIHDVLRKALQERLDNPAESHLRLLSKWIDPYNLPYNYAWRWYDCHLVEAGKRADLRKLLFDFNWLLERLKHTNTLSLFLALSHFPGDEAIKLVQDAVRLSSNALDQNPSYLAGQLCGRLGAFDNEEIEALVASARDWRRSIWLQPLTASLVQPGGPLIHTFDGHTKAINSMAVTPDGKTIVSGSWDGTIKLWDIESGKELRMLKEDTGGVTSVAVTPDGKTIVSGSWNGTIRLWGIESGKELRMLKEDTGEVTSVAVTPDGKKIVSGSDDGTIRLWDIESGKELNTLKGHTNAIISMAVTPDGKTIVSGSWDGTIKLWDIESSKEPNTLKGHANAIISVAVTPDGKTIVSGSLDGTIRLWDIESGKELRMLKEDTGGVASVAVTPDGKTIVSGSENGTIRLWDIESGKELNTLKGHTNAIISMAVTPDGKTIVSGSRDGTIRLWDIESSKEPNTLKGHTNAASSVAVTPDGKTIVSGSLDGTIRLWDIESGKELRMLKEDTGRVASVAVTPDGKTIVSGSENGTIRLWDIESGEELQTLEGHKFWINSVAVTPDGKKIVSGSDDWTIKLWDIESGKEMNMLGRDRGRITSVVVTPDSKYILSGSRDCIITLWDIESGEELHTLEGHKFWINSVAVTPDGKKIVSGSDDGTIKLWDIENHTELHTFEGHTKPVTSVAVTFDGKKIISGSYDNTIKLRDIESGRSIADFVCDYQVMAVAVADTLIVASDASGCIHLLHLTSPGQPRAANRT